MPSVFDLFDGTRPMAKAIGEAASTVHYWRKQRRIPAWRHDWILAVAAKRDIPVTREDLVRIPPTDDLGDVSDAPPPDEGINRAA